MLSGGVGRGYLRRGVQAEQGGAAGHDPERAAHRRLRRVGIAGLRTAQHGLQHRVQPV